jgi:hypothetical protein
MINAHESSLVGQWLTQDSLVVADETSHRIELLTSNYLVELASSSDGWSTLFKDPVNGRLWERTYPQSQLQGGGPPALNCIEISVARTKYNREA